MGTTAVAIMLPAAVFSRQARHVRAGRRHATVLPPAVNGWNAAAQGRRGGRTVAAVQKTEVRFLVL